MKLIPVLLGISLVANAALLVLPRPGEAARARAAAPADSTITESVPLPRGAGRATGGGAAIAAAFREDKLDVLRDELLAAGIDEDTVRDIVRARIQKRYEARMKALNTTPDGAAAWWKNDDGWQSRTKEQRAAMRALQDELNAEHLRLLGESSLAANLRNNPWMERQYGFLPPDKREALLRLEQDYNELSQELNAESRGFRMPEDAEKARFLEEEKRRDLAEILGPEGFADYERRRSRTANNLRWRMTQMDATEAEYVAIFEIQKEFDDRHSNYDAFGNSYTDRSTPEKREARAAAEKAMRAEIKDTLGAERYKTYVRSQDHEYQQLQNATKRFALPADTPARVFDLRDEVPQSALKIAENPNLSAEEKKAEVTRLAAQAREQVASLLGPDVAKVYLDQNSGMQWLRQLEQGTIITFTEDGGQTHRSLSSFQPKPAPKAK